MKRFYETVVILFGTIGWWGFVYPELCLTEDVYEQECGEYMVEEPENEMSGSGKESCKEERPSGIWEGIWTDRYRSGWHMGEIRIKSRLAEYVCQVKEK